MFILFPKVLILKKKKEKSIINANLKKKDARGYPLVTQ
jgi:hypothetical protein